MFRYLIENNLISSSQPGFKPEDSCINQLLSITHKICKSFDGGFEVRGVFLDISKAFNKVWHKGIIFKLTQNGILGKLLSVLSDFLKDRKEDFLKWTSFFIGRCKRRRLRSIFWFISTIQLMVYHQMQNCLQIIRLCYGYFTMLTLLQMN